MLLDRKKINRISRWFAIALATIFALSGILLGVGSKVGGNIFAGCAQSTPSADSQSSVGDRESYFLTQLKQNPKDTDAMLQLANLYAGSNVKRYQDAITWFNKYLQIVPNSAEVRLRMGSIYMTDLNDPASAVKVLTDATKIDPGNADAYVQLGLAAKAALQNQVAIQAWNKYLQLQPNGSYAADIKNQINQLEHPASSNTGTTGTSTAPAASAPAAPAAPAP
ncbi:MAG: tetratricopeptide repeat protein [Actinomycetota bacterium]|nr:tetratricopeptide repeat protein [Actinomycetota bacterium]MCL6092905.1 tetratricopeptide repeat protein [Actinomycetota bacterium]MDA8166477.1 tetratricopeptide repeat protein [Actinomycetota bacterium]